MSITNVFGFSTLEPEVTTRAAADAEGLSDDSETQRLEAWNKWINGTLIEWGVNTSELAADDLIPPERSIVSMASEMAIQLRERRWPAPTWVVPSGDGGIVFEWHFQNKTITLEITATMQWKLLQYDNHRITFRKTYGNGE